MMPAHRRPKIAEQLPRPVLKQLVKRLETAPLHGYTFDDHAAWLKKKGYSMSRSAIHRFCQELRKIKAEKPDGVDILALYLDGVERSKMCL